MRSGSNRFALKRLRHLFTLSDRREIVYPSLIIAGSLLLWATISQASRTLHVLAQVLSSGTFRQAGHGLTTFLLLFVLLAQLLVWPILWGCYGLIAFHLLRHKRQKPAQPQKLAHATARFESWHRERPFVETDKLRIPLLDSKEKQAIHVPVMASVLAPDTLAQEETEAEPEIITGKSPTLPVEHHSAPFLTLATKPPVTAPLQSGFSGTFAPLDLESQGQLHLRVQTCTSAGSASAEQELPNIDSLVALQGTRAYSSQVLPFGLFVVADGKNIDDNGQQASRLAVQAIQQAVLPPLLGSTIMDDAVLIERMGNGVRQANRVLYQHNLQNNTSMQATLAAGLVIGTRAIIVNIGDNRVYHYRKDKGLTQVTRDHSVVARLMSAKMITANEVYTHPDRHLIYRTIGKFARVDEIDSFIISLQAGDSLLFCSDGLWKTIRDADIKDTLERNLAQPSQASALLVQSAVERKEKDSASVILLNVM